MALMAKHLPAMQGDPGSIPGLRRSPGGGNGYPLQHSFLENSMDRGVQQAIVHGVTKRHDRVTNTFSFRATHHLGVCGCHRFFVWEEKAIFFGKMNFSTIPPLWLAHHPGNLSEPQGEPSVCLVLARLWGIGQITAALRER